MIGLRGALAEYLSMRRALGFKLRYHGQVLPHFVSFLERQGISHITTELALLWANQPKGIEAVVCASRLSMVRSFAQYRSAADPKTEIPPQGLLPARRLRKPPYIYSDAEVSRLMRAAGQLHSGTGLRPRTYVALLGLLAATGMRVHEAIALNHEDVDLRAGILAIRHTKFGKSRLIPIHPSNQRALQEYSDFRNKVHPLPKAPSFFLSERATRLCDGNVHLTFIRLRCRVGLQNSSGQRSPRLHDLRHRFAVRTLLRWYRTGVDVEQALPRLSAYLGHTRVTDTYWYLSTVPELMQLVSKKLDHLSGGL
jgi:integrase/recombinase XerD